MVQLTDAELCLLEQLVYLDEEVAAAAGVNAFFGKIIPEMKDHPLAEILSIFDNEALLRLVSLSSLRPQFQEHSNRP